MTEEDESRLPGKLWPVHPKPLDDELLSSWLARLALAHGQSIKAFCALVWPGRGVQTRELDLWNVQSVFETLAEKTNTRLARILDTTLASYQGWLFENLPSQRRVHWILSRHLNGRPRKGFGLQFCPWCLVSDEGPYFRRRWRLAFTVLCPTHRALLLERCQKCGAGVCYERQPSYEQSSLEPWSMTQCYQCNSDLRDFAIDRYRQVVEDREIEFQSLLETTLKGGWVEMPNNGPIYSYLFFAGLHHIIGRLVDGKTATMLQKALLQSYGINLQIDFLPQKKTYLERLNVTERRGLFQALHCLLQDWPNRFIEFCRANRLASHFLIRGKNDLPFWYVKVIREHLTKTPYSVSKEEIASILKHIEKEGSEISSRKLNRFLSDYTIGRARAAGLIKKNDYPRICSYCHATNHQIKAGLTSKGIQEFLCRECGLQYRRPDYPVTKVSKRTFRRHPEAVKLKAIELYEAGRSYKQIEDLLSIPHSTVIVWCKSSRYVPSSPLISAKSQFAIICCQPDTNHPRQASE